MVTLKPLEMWICDTCGEVIEKPDDGYVVWNYERQDGAISNLRKDFRIIHQSRCNNDRINSPASSALVDFLGQAGLNKLLRFLSHGPIRVHCDGATPPQLADMDAFVDFFRRVQVPYYEEARCHLQNHDVLERIFDSNEMYPYQTLILNEIA